MIKLRRRAATPVETALTRTVKLLPPDGGVAGLLDNLGSARGRPITLLRRPLPPDGPSGAWIALPDKDYIVVSTPVAPSHEAAIVAHEVGHMMLGHAGADLTDDARQLAPDVSPHVAARFLSRYGYGGRQEQEAEVFATLLAAEQAHRERAALDLVSTRLR